MRTGWLKHFASSDGRSLARALIVLVGVHAFLAGMMAGNAAFADHGESALCLAVPGMSAGDGTIPGGIPHTDASCCLGTCLSLATAFPPKAVKSPSPAMEAVSASFGLRPMRTPRRNFLRHALAARAPPSV